MARLVALPHNKLIDKTAHFSLNLACIYPTLTLSTFLAIIKENDFRLLGLK
jgi:hypothetical protein